MEYIKGNTLGSWVNGVNYTAAISLLCGGYKDHRTGETIPPLVSYNQKEERFVLQGTQLRQVLKLPTNEKELADATFRCRGYIIPNKLHFLYSFSSRRGVHTAVEMKLKAKMQDSIDGKLPLHEACDFEILFGNYVRDSFEESDGYSTEKRIERAQSAKAAIAQGQAAPDEQRDTDSDDTRSATSGNVNSVFSNLITNNPMLRPFNYRHIQRRQSFFDNCLSCNMNIKSTTSHTSPSTCLDCNGPILSCQSGPTHNSPYLCYLYRLLYQTRESMNSADRFRLLSEFETQPGIWKCAYCAMDTNESWLHKKPHGIIEPSLGLWVPGCLVYGEKAAALGSGQLNVNNNTGNNNNDKVIDDVSSYVSSGSNKLSYPVFKNSSDNNLISSPDILHTDMSILPLSSHTSHNHVLPFSGGSDNCIDSTRPDGNIAFLISENLNLRKQIDNEYHKQQGFNSEQKSHTKRLRTS